MRWLVGQAVKTLASHAENMGSIPVRVTRKRKSRTLVLLFLFLCPAQNRTHLRHIINLHFIMLVFAQGVRIPPLAVSCVARCSSAIIDLQRNVWYCFTTRSRFPYLFAARIFFLPFVPPHTISACICSLGNIPQAVCTL